MLSLALKKDFFTHEFLLLYASCLHLLQNRLELKWFSANACSIFLKKIFLSCHRTLAQFQTLLKESTKHLHGFCLFVISLSWYWLKVPTGKKIFMSPFKQILRAQYCTTSTKLAWVKLPCCRTRKRIIQVASNPALDAFNSTFEL